MKVAVTALSVALALTSVASAQEPGGHERLPLDRAIALALAGNRQLQRAALERRKADERLVAARTGRLPRFDVHAQASQLLTPIDFFFPQGVFGTYPGIGPVPDRDRSVTTGRQPMAFVSANVVQPLTQLRRIGLGVRLSGIARDAAGLEVDRTRQTLVGDVRRLYYGILGTQASLRAAEQALALYRELERTVSQHVSERLLLRSDLLDVAAALAREEHRALILRNAGESQQERMNLLLGRDLGIRFETDQIAAATADDRDLAAAQAEALRARPDVRQAQLRLQQATLDRDLKQAEALPDVSLRVSYLSFVNVQMLPSNVAAVGVSASWEPWSWGRRRRELNERALTIQQARLEVEDSEALVLADVAARHRALAEARASLRVSDAVRASAEEKLRVGTVRLASDAALLTEVLRLRAQLAQAVEAADAAVLSFWSARAEFERSIGSAQP